MWNTIKGVRGIFNKFHMKVAQWVIQNQGFVSLKKSSNLFFKCLNLLLKSYLSSLEGGLQRGDFVMVLLNQSFHVVVVLCEGCFQSSALDLLLVQSLTQRLHHAQLHPTRLLGRTALVRSRRLHQFHKRCAVVVLPA